MPEKKLGPFDSLELIPPFVRQGEYEVNMPLGLLRKWVAEEQSRGLQLCPDFQRGHVWTKARKIAFVEFFMRGGRTGRVIYFNSPDWRGHGTPGGYDEFVVVDGLQRMTALLEFLDDRVPLFGKKWSQYKEYGQCLMNYDLRLHVNELKTRAEVLQWYLDLNKGGVVHTAKEIARVQALLDEELAKG